jgi:hypothetical protein
MPKKKPVKEIDIQTLSNRCLAIIEGEVTKIETGKIAELIDHKAADTLNNYMRTLVAYRREERQQETSANIEEELKSMSDQDLDMLAKQTITYLEKENGKKK